jgi:hypothetical protein
MQRRTCLKIQNNELQEFYVQLEYNESSNPIVEEEWVDIAWFDHQPTHRCGHDITKEGLHMDIRHPTGSNRKVVEFPSVPLDDAPTYCEKYFEREYIDICDQYAIWLDNPNPMGWIRRLHPEQ